MTNRGIDYSPSGSTVNRNPKTGIRYGIISALSLTEFLWESVECSYTARCPACVTELGDDIPESCPACKASINEDDVYGDEPDARNIDENGIRGQVDSSNDVWVFRSPYYTRGAFCSPCAPGAVSLGSPCDDGERAYCLGHDWYDSGTAPYPVYRTEDDSLVKP